MTMSQIADPQAVTTAAETPGNLHFDRIGGESAVRNLVDRFYHHMDTLPEAQKIRAMHPPKLAPIKEVLFKYLVGWLGGPPLYVAERDAWMACMTRALDEVVTDAGLKTELTQAFFKTATFLRNQ
jgi:hemoglobin